MFSRSEIVVSCGHNDKHNDKQTDKQTDTIENIYLASLRYAGG